MTGPRYPSAGFWLTVALVAVLVAYPLSFGPAVWYRMSHDASTTHPVAATGATEYRPIQAPGCVLTNIGHALGQAGTRLVRWWQFYLATQSSRRPIPGGWERLWLQDLPADVEARVSGERI